MKVFLTKHFPIIIIVFVVGLIAITNYSTGTFLTGGDNLHPEFNLSTNIQRSIFAVWQEYQGLGLLGGMGHSADLLRQLLLTLLSVALPVSGIRWLYTFATLFVGSAGTYFLSRKLIQRFCSNLLFKQNLLALTAGLFYLLNLSTVQSYFTPFEVFTAHFAALPWLLFLTINFFEKRNSKNSLILGLGLLIATPGAYVPTLLVVYISAAVLSSQVYLKSDGYLKSLFIFLSIVLLVNSFWLLPFIFFTLTNAGVNVDAKINQMATDAIYLQNKEFGGIKDVALLKGFWFNNVEPSLSGKYVYMLGNWKNYFSEPVIKILGYTIFGLVCLGGIFSLKTRKKEAIIPLILFLFSMSMLLTATPPFSWLNDFLRNYVPLFGQIFRFPFTKFSILASLSFALLIPLAIISIQEHLQKISNKIYILLSAIIIAIMIILIFPVFRGNLFYSREKIAIPKEYFQTFNYFKSQDPNTRIADFPQYTYWGWNFYDWGYSGSGFLWYGIKQPILDRAFDVWSQDDENYYWEVNKALYSKDYQSLNGIFQKYDVNWVLIDGNVINPASPKSLFNEELKNMLSKLPNVKKVQEFGKIKIYKVALNDNSHNFVSSLTSLSSANPYSWSDYDQEYQTYGDYQTSNNPSQTENFYPFRSLFTNKAQDQLAFQTQETKDSVEFVSKVPQYQNPVNLHIPSLITQNQTLPVTIVTSRTANTTKIDLELMAPEIYLKAGDKTYKLWGNNTSRNVFSENLGSASKLNVNGVSNFTIPKLKDGESKNIGTTSLTLDENNILVLNENGEEISRSTIAGNSIKDSFQQEDSFISLPYVPKNSTLIIKVAKLNDDYSSFTINPAQQVNSNLSQIENCDNFRKQYFSYFIKQGDEQKLLELSAQNATSCISFYLPTLDHDQGYYLSVQNQNLEGQALHFWVLNEDEKTPIIDTYLPKSKTPVVSKLILPPMEKFGKAYSIHLENISIGNTKSGNLVGEININPIPYYFLSNIVIQNSPVPIQTFNKAQVSTQHPNPSLYLIDVSGKGEKEISLSQTYSKYWALYKVNSFGLLDKFLPFLGQKQKQHIAINNWANGWIISGQGKYIAIYLPQYLEYIGFVLTSGTLLILAFWALKKRKNADQEVDSTNVF